MVGSYECVRSAGGKQLHLVFQAGAFECLPFEVRLLGPWFNHGGGDVASLKPAHRSALAHCGYVIVSGPFSGALNPEKVDC
jgi:hypothetical protein